MAEEYKHILTGESMNPRVLEAQYEVRGAVTILAQELEQKLRAAKRSGVPSGLPFDEVVYCNIGNPQRLQQRPVTFVRQVCALLEYPELAELAPGAFAPDAVARARRLLDDGFLVGAYSHSKGHGLVRRDVADFIAARDGVACDPETVYCTNGASAAVGYLLDMIVRDDNGARVGVMTPTPQYPLYAALMRLHNGVEVAYELDEAHGWSLVPAALEEAYKKAVGDGVDVRALVVINPNNPTGQVLTVECMQEIVRFCVRHRVILIADEVYQENLYDAGARFTSFRRCAHEMGADVYGRLELASLHSVSKGFLGECGHRGGYVQLENFHPDVHAQLYKLVSVSLCSNTLGQVVLDCMVNPPRPGDASHEQYEKERTAIIDSLRRRALKLCAALNTLEGFSCTQPSGSMYLFPSIVLPPKALEAARKAGVPADTFCALQLVQETGICVVPGSGFGQHEGTFHFRTTFLPPEDHIEAVANLIKKFHAAFVAKYA